MHKKIRSFSSDLGASPFFKKCIYIYIYICTLFLRFRYGNSIYSPSRARQKRNPFDRNVATISRRTTTEMNSPTNVNIYLQLGYCAQCTARSNFSR